MFSKEGRRYHYQQMSSEYCFELWLSAEGFKRRAGQFLECFGHSASDFKVLYD